MKFNMAVITLLLTLSTISFASTKKANAQGEQRQCEPIKYDGILTAGAEVINTGSQDCEAIAGDFADPKKVKEFLWYDGSLKPKSRAFGFLKIKSISCGELKYVIVRVVLSQCNENYSEHIVTARASDIIEY